VDDVEAVTLIQSADGPYASRESEGCVERETHSSVDGASANDVTRKRASGGRDPDLVAAFVELTHQADEVGFNAPDLETVRQEKDSHPCLRSEHY